MHLQICTRYGAFTNMNSSKLVLSLMILISLSHQHMSKSLLHLLSSIVHLYEQNIADASRCIGIVNITLQNHIIVVSKLQIVTTTYSKVIC